jgi:hypothetical protein
MLGTTVRLPGWYRLARMVHRAREGSQRSDTMPVSGHEALRRFAIVGICLTVLAGLGGCQAAGRQKVSGQTARIAGASAAGAAAGGLIGAAVSGGPAIVPGMVLGAGVGTGAALMAISVQ